MKKLTKIFILTLLTIFIVKAAAFNHDLLKLDTAILDIEISKNSLKIINEQDRFGQTPLHKSIIANDHHGLSYLLALNADPSIRDNIKKAPIDYAIFLARNTVMIECLINKHADINTQDDVGQTPLFLAASKGNAECFDLLLRSGARADVFDKAGASVLHRLYLDQNKKLFDKLIVKLKEDIKYQALDRESIIKNFNERDPISRCSYGIDDIALKY